MTPRSYVCRLGPVSVGLITTDATVLTYLREFYAIAESSVPPGNWTIEARVARPAVTMAVNRWGVGRAVDANARRVRLQAADARCVAITTRKTLREVLVDYCEQRRYVMLHASAVGDHERVIVIVGDKGSGKTTLALKAMLGRGMRLLSNDHLIVYPDSADQPTTGLMLTSLPTMIPLKIGTYLDLEAELPSPWSTEGLDLDVYRTVARHQLYRLDRRVLYTYSSLGQPNPLAAALHDAGSGPDVIVALARYTHGHPAVVPVDDPVEALLPHVRTDWMFDPELNQRYLPRTERARADYLTDARQLMAALADRASIVSFAHGGDPTLLLHGTNLERKIS
ncbi:hypothetical protein ACFYTQ_12190 [Nocardia sp. NPDC004068]|uniref:hypothetical protein n=1 Tax=Nocardia sp. NPDC004068 TaxID=3364303 RepID=UPI0036AA9389